MLSRSSIRVGIVSIVIEYRQAKIAGDLDLFDAQSVPSSPGVK
jgi:hypothetical protein